MESLHCSKTTRADSKGAVESLTIGHDNRLRALSQLCLPATETPNWRASESRNAPAAIPPFFSLSLPLSPSHTLSLSLSLSHTHTHTHTHIHTLSLFLSHTLSRWGQTSDGDGKLAGERVEECPRRHPCLRTQKNTWDKTGYEPPSCRGCLIRTYPSTRVTSLVIGVAPFQPGSANSRSCNSSQQVTSLNIADWTVLYVPYRCRANLARIRQS